MKIKKLKLDGPCLIEPKIFYDNRGFLYETWNHYKFLEKKLKISIAQITNAYSKKNVLRGLHLQTKFSQGKYLSVLKGEIFDVAVDLRKNSKTFGKYFSIKISDKSGISIFIPPGFAHGFVGLKKENILSYHCTNYRSSNSEIGIKWNDKDLKIKWPIKKPTLSNKDKKNISFKNFILNA